jgi:hypothetical protein
MSGVDSEARKAQDPPAADADPVDGDATVKAAEELAGRLAGWVVRSASRAREEAEDVWAEAQELRRRW